MSPSTPLALKVTTIVYNPLFRNSWIRPCEFNNVEQCCIEMLNQHHLTGWPNAHDMSNSTMLNGVKPNIAFVGPGLKLGAP